MKLITTIEINLKIVSACLTGKYFLQTYDISARSFPEVQFNYFQKVNIELNFKSVRIESYEIFLKYKIYFNIMP